MKIFLLILVGICEPALGWVSGGPVIFGPCPAGSLNVTEYSGPNYSQCGWDLGGGLAYFGPGSTWKGYSMEISAFSGFDKSYVPYTGNWGMKTYFCPATGLSACTIAKSTRSLPGRHTQLINSNYSIGSLGGSLGVGFGGLVGQATFATGVTICVVLVDASGSEWSSASIRTCRDAPGVLPTTAAFCYLNNQQSLNVDLGTLNRGDINTLLGATPGVTTQASVVCSGDAQITAKFQLQYAPLTIGGQPVIQSSTTGLGVAVSLLGKPMGPSDSLELSFHPGINAGLVFHFEAVRDPNVPLGNIAAGPMKANAVLVMTQQ